MMKHKSTFTGVWLGLSLATLCCGAARAAETDNSAAELKTGDTYYQSQNYAQAMQWYQKAADLGNADAMCDIGILYQNGLGVEQNYATALAWFRKAVDKGSNKATYYLSGIHSLMDIHKAQSLQQLQKTADSGDVDAMCEMGLFYEEEGIDQDYSKALPWFLKAANLGNIDAMRAVADIYLHGKYRVDANRSLALQWYSKAADLGDAPSMRGMGDIFCMREGGKQDFAQAMQWYRKAAAKGDTEAMRDIAVLYEGSDGVKEDFAQTLQWYQKAADAGDGEAMYQLGHLSEPNYAMAMDWYLKGADRGNANAMYAIGCMYLYGKGVVQSDDTAMDWLLKADDAGSVGAEISIDIFLKDKGHQWKGRWIPPLIWN
jgi:TPR repeat protein